MRQAILAAMTAASAAAALALAGCASAPPGDRGGLFDRVAGGGHIHGDARGVTITGMDNAASALPLAIGHCHHFHLSAQYAGRVGDAYRYRCTPG